MSQSLKDLERRNAIRRCDPISLFGLTFYPITMRHYEEFLSCKDAIILRMTTLPVKYMVKDYLSAIFSFELDSLKETGKPVGLFQKALKMLELSLRIESNFIGDGSIRMEEKNGEVVIKEILVTQANKTVSITALDFSQQIRQLIADQNGLELPDESQNVDLVLANAGKLPLKQFEKLIEISVIFVAVDGKVTVLPLN